MPIPWAAILAHGPVILAAAEKLLATTGSSKFAQQAQGIEGRLGMLERVSEDSARLLQQMAQQLEALRLAQEETVRRTRVALRLGLAGTVLAIGAVAIAVVW